MDMIVLQAMMAAAGRSSARFFSSTPYAGNNTTNAVETFVDSTDGALTMIRKKAGTDTIAIYDTIRGASARKRVGFFDEDLSSAFAFAGSKRIFTGANYNVLGTDYLAWSFLKRAGFCDIVTFNGQNPNGISIAHALGETPVAMYMGRRSGAGQLDVLWKVGENSCFLSGNGDLTAQPGCTAVSSGAITPSGTLFPSGGTGFAVLFGSGLGHAAAGSYVGTQTFGVAGTQDVTLPFQPLWMILWGRFNATIVRSAVYDTRLTSNVGFYDGGAISSLPFTVDGTTLTAVSGATSACISGQTYRYIIVG